MHNRQGNLTFRGGAKGGPTSGVLEGVTVVLVASPLGDFFFLVLFFFFLATWLLESRLSPGEVEDEDVEVGVEGERSTLGSTRGCSGGGTDELTADTIGTKEVENNQTGNPTVNPGRDNVAIYGAPTFPRGGK